MKLNEFEFIARLEKVVDELTYLLLPGKESVEAEKLWKIRDELKSLLRLVKPGYTLDDLLTDILDYVLQPYTRLPRSAVATAKSDRRNEEEGESC